MMKAITHYDLWLDSTGHTPRTGFSISAAWYKLIAYAERQEEKRMFWAALSLLSHGTFFTIGTMAVILFTGTNFALLTATSLIMAMVLVVNLAALPTKYIVPVFFFSVLADVLIIITALALWFS